jgi:hypothetical protein
MVPLAGPPLEQTVAAPGARRLEAELRPELDAAHGRARGEGRDAAESGRAENVVFGLPKFARLKS